MMWYKPDKRDAKNIGSKGNLGLPKDGSVTLEDKLKIKRNGHKMNQKGVCWVRQNILILIYFWHMHLKKNRKLNWQIE